MPSDKKLIIGACAIGITCSLIGGSVASYFLLNDNGKSPTPEPLLPQSKPEVVTGMPASPSKDQVPERIAPTMEQEFEGFLDATQDFIESPQVEELLRQSEESAEKIQQIVEREAPKLQDRMQKVVESGEVQELLQRTEDAIEELNWKGFSIEEIMRALEIFQQPEDSLQIQQLKDSVETWKKEGKNPKARHVFSDAIERMEADPSTISSEVTALCQWSKDNDLWGLNRSLKEFIASETCATR